MLRTIRAKFTGGALKPLERLDIEEGVEVILSIEDVLSSGKTGERAGSDETDSERRRRLLNEVTEDITANGGGLRMSENLAREQPYDRVAARAEMARSLESAYGSVKPSSEPEDFDEISRNAKDAKAEDTLRELSSS